MTSDIQRTSVHSLDGIRAFTLIELLVSVAILAVLFALLVPSLSGALEMGRQAACVNNLRQVGIASGLHVAEHQGNLPLVGVQFMGLPYSRICSADGLDDSGELRYIYYDDGGIRRPAPFSAQLGAYLGLSLRMDSRSHLEEDLQRVPVRSPLSCPSDRSKRKGYSLASDGWGITEVWVAPRESLSYGLNECVLGVRWYKNYPQGRLRQIPNPANMMLACDALSRTEWESDPTTGSLCFFANTADVTLWDCWQGAAAGWIGGSPSMFDWKRHRGRINVVFCDGHVETRAITESELSKVNVSRGLGDFFSGP